MASQYTRSYVDKTDEKSATSIWIRQMTAANFDDTATLLAALGTAMDGVTLGAPIRTVTQSNSLALPNSFLDADTGAQRELKVMVIFRDDTNGKLSRIEIPTADPSLFAGGTDTVPAGGAGPFGALETALEAIGRSVDGNTITVLKHVLVGRNL